MKKTILISLAVLIAVLFTACPVQEQTKEEMLKQSKGWKLTAATSDPAYLLLKEDGTEVPITSLFDGFMYDDELDDIIYFKENKSEILNYGKDKSTCNGKFTGIERSLGNWDLVTDTRLKFYFPAYEELLEAVVLALDESTLKVSVKIAEDDGEAKVLPYRGVTGTKTVRNYVFTLTYSIAK
ncbi:MAG: hypothetical protein FWF70_00765 [Bacteroidetes bacterium]|nr:hypothetical protein [Bacteroidota bacterium]MCL1967944.1 hypothetical protein [Bacteroidota bacterium]